MTTAPEYCCEICAKPIPDGRGRFTTGAHIVCMDCNGDALRELLREDTAKRDAEKPSEPEEPEPEE